MTRYPVAEAHRCFARVAIAPAPAGALPDLPHSDSRRVRSGRACTCRRRAYASNAKDPAECDSTARPRRRRGAARSRAVGDGPTGSSFRSIAYWPRSVTRGSTSASRTNTVCAHARAPGSGCPAAHPHHEIAPTRVRTQVSPATLASRASRQWQDRGTVFPVRARAGAETDGAAAVNEEARRAVAPIDAAESCSLRPLVGGGRGRCRGFRRCRCVAGR